MLKHVRFLFSATLVAVLAVSALFLSAPVKVQACDDSPPSSLLSLYLTSDLIVTGEIRSQKDGSVTYDEADYSIIEIVRGVRVLSILKGKSPSSFTFVQSDYREKSPGSDNSFDKEDFGYHLYGFEGDTQLLVGGKYLFFLRKSAETGKWELADPVTGARRLDNQNQSIYEERLKELKSIVKKKKSGQAAAVTEWLMKSVKHPVTRWDGLIVISQSVDSIRWESHGQSSEPLVLTGEFSPYTPEIARSLTDSQKEYLSSSLFSRMPQTLFERDTLNFYSILTNVVSSWDKSRLATYAFSILKTLDESETDKLSSTMNYISAILEDEQLGDISYRYWEIDMPVEEVEEVGPVEEAAVSEEESIIAEDAPVQDAVKVEGVDVDVNAVSDAQKTDQLESETETLTASQRREKLLQEFIKRYEYLLVRGFQLEKAAAENDQ